MWNTVKLGDVVVAAYDVAATCTSDPREVSLLAARVVTVLLRRAERARWARGARWPPPDAPAGVWEVSEEELHAASGPNH